MGDDKHHKIIFPLPNETNSPIALGRTDSHGQLEFSVQFREIGRHTVRVTSADGRVMSDPISIQVLPNCQSKGHIKQRNRILRASIRASTSHIEIQKHLDESRLTCDIAPDNLKDDAIKEYDETSKTAHGRLEELRLIERKRGMSINAEYGGATVGASINSEERKSSPI